MWVLRWNVSNSSHHEILGPPTLIIANDLCVVFFALFRHLISFDDLGRSEFVYPLSLSPFLLVESLLACHHLFVDSLLLIYVDIVDISHVS